MSLTLIANLYSVSDDKVNIGSGRTVRLSSPPPQGMFQNGQRSLSIEHLTVHHELLVCKPKVYRYYDFNDPRIIIMLGELPKKN